jgi:excisionase family DNA binding protein
MQNYENIIRNNTEKESKLILIPLDQLQEIVSQAVERCFNSQKPEPIPDEMLTIREASKLILLSVSTIYGLVSRSQIPSNKQGKRLYFFKSELLDWIKSGRRKTIKESLADGDKIRVINKKNRG